MAEILDRQIDHDLVRPKLRSETATLRAGERVGETALHRVVVVGGGAAGLELVTRLGDRLGRRSRASVTLVENARSDPFGNMERRFKDTALWRVDQPDR